MNIGELSAKTGVSPRSLRHYEKQGFITPEREANGYRRYDDRAAAAATAIHAIYSVGFTSDDVRAILPCAVGTAPHDDPALLARVAELRETVSERIDSLNRTRDALSEFLRAAGERSDEA